jgi:hypothetical protein
MCNAVAEQIEQEHMRELLTPPKPKKKKGKAAEKPFVCALPLEKPMCDQQQPTNTSFRTTQNMLK